MATGPTPAGGTNGSTGGSGGRRALPAELILAGLETGRAVDPDGLLSRVRHDHQRAGIQLGQRVAAGLADEGSGQSLPPGTRVGLDILVAGDTAAIRDDAQLGNEPAAGEGAEPAAVARLGQFALGGDPAFQEIARGGRLLQVVAGRP